MIFASILAMFAMTGGTATPAEECNQKCEDKQEYQKARRNTPRNPIPAYVVACESGGELHKRAIDGLGGGRYQIIPSTWRVSLPTPRFVRISGGNKGPVWSSRLLQDKVAHIIVRRDGLGAWSCA